MKMENANVEFVTFEAQDVIATSYYALGKYLGAVVGTTVPDFNKLTGDSSNTISFSSNLNGFTPNAYYKISENYSLDGTTINFTAELAPDVTATSHSDYLVPNEYRDLAGVFAAWLSQNGKPQQ